MLIAAIISRLRGAARSFAAANQGNIAVIFAIALLPVLGFVGAAIDYSRAVSARSSMQAALDSTALMLSRDLTQGVITTSQINDATAQTYFTALYTNKDAQSVNVTASYTAVNGSLGSTIQVTGAGAIKTDFMNVAGFPTLNFKTSSTAAWGTVRMRVALALDNTGSMAQNGKITALRSAVAGSGGLIDQLSNLAKNPGDVYISVVPFAKDVNVGATNYTQTWIDWTDWQNPPTVQPALSPQPILPTVTTGIGAWANIGPGSYCPFPSSALNANFNCTTSPVNASPTSLDSGGKNIVPSSGNICPSVDGTSHTLYNGCWDSVKTSTTAQLCTGSSCSCTGAATGCTCTSGSGKVCTTPTFTHTWHANATSTWTGCITDRTKDYDTTNDPPTAGTTATLFPANQYYEKNNQGYQAYCKSGNNPPLQPITPLSYDWSALKAGINAMQPTGGTNQAVGLAWAWETLQQGAPMNAPAEDPNYTYKKAIIILSDGLNTEDRWPANGDGGTQFNGAIDARQMILCDNIKKQGITIYTIQVDTSSPPDPVSPVLSYCASGSQNFYMLYSASQVVTAFNSIGTSLAQLRVAR
jgi:Flp pilus assembly protein TadG